MAFSTALYYPRINLTNEAWLKSAILYWDTIQTIVPISIEKPYTNQTALELHEAGVLRPFFVESSMDDVESLTEDVIKFLHSDEVAQLMLVERAVIHTEKLPSIFRELSHIHPEKLPYKIRHMFGSFMKGQWLEVPSNFAYFYMTLLATRIAEKIGAGLLTDISASDKLSTSLRLDAKISIPNYDEIRTRHYRRNIPHELAQGLLAELLIKRIAIDPSTPTSKILKFKSDNVSSLGKLRTKIGSLTQILENDVPIEALSQAINDIYVNEVIPVMSDLQENLSASGIRSFVDGYLKVALLHVSTTSLMMSVGLNIPQALLAGAGISLTASTIMYNLEKEKMIRENPFSYLLTAKKFL